MKKICVVEDIRINILKKTSFVKSDDGHAISRQEKRWLPKELHVFPPRKMALSLPRRVALGLPSPSPSPRECTDIRAYVR